MYGDLTRSPIYPLTASSPGPFCFARLRESSEPSAPDAIVELPVLFFVFDGWLITIFPGAGPERFRPV